MYELISEIISRFGGRISCSREEIAAQQYFKTRLEEFCSRVEFHSFRLARDGMFQSLKGFCLAFYLTLVLYWLSPTVAAILGLLNVLLFLGHFVTYRQWLDFLFPKHQSANVIGVLEPQSEVKSTLIIAGHIDSVWEFQWWYKLKNNGAVLSVLSGFLFLFSAIFLLVNAFIPLEMAGTITWSIFALLSPITITYFTIHNNVKVDGAIDNLTGVALAYGVGKALVGPGHNGVSSLKNTRVKLVSFGCEEVGLKGAQAYVRDYLQEMREENAVLLNIDSIKDVDQLSVVRGELFTLVKYPPKLVELMEDAFTRQEVAVRNIVVQVGASDASAFAWKNIPAVCLIGLQSDQLDPTYHTRLDKLENLSPQAMETLKTVLLDFIYDWDKKQPVIN